MSVWSFVSVTESIAFLTTSTVEWCSEKGGEYEKDVRWIWKRWKMRRWMERMKWRKSRNWRGGEKEGDLVCYGSWGKGIRTRKRKWRGCGERSGMVDLSELSFTVLWRADFSLRDLQEGIEHLTQPSIQTSRSTRSSSAITLLRPSVTSSLKFADRSIAIAVPPLWNKLQL